MLAKAFLAEVLGEDEVPAGARLAEVRLGA